jgi:hypothetical protein
MRKCVVTLVLTPDQGDNPDPATWDWQALLDLVDPVQVIGADYIDEED